MATHSHATTPSTAGIRLEGTTDDAALFMDQLTALGLADKISMHRDVGGDATTFQLKEDVARWLTPDFDTIALAGKLNLDPAHCEDDRRREIVIAMMTSPVAFAHPTYESLASAIQVRQNIAEAAGKTELAFDTSNAAKRHEGYWTYSEEHGFTVLHGKSLIAALRKATQPEVSGRCYDFSCYRASEYVILLGIAEELQAHNPALLARLQRQWEISAIQSGAFHDTFLIEYGSMESPLPPRFYVPGDRLWFRNPDDHSSDAEGYEGSWVIYLGNGLFSNFWARHQPYTLTSKCVEIYHWRHGTYTDRHGDLRIDESIVEARVAETMSDPEAIAALLPQMMRLREPKGIYRNGGCIDTSREYPKPICSKSGGFVLPDA